MTSETMWLPAKWLDEVVPDPQVDVNAFICHSPQYGWLLRAVEDQVSEYEEGDGAIHLTEGETVKFHAFENYGDFELEVRDDGTFEADGDIPSKANCFRLDRDTDTLQPSLSELVENGAGFYGALKPGHHDIDAYWWSNETFVFTFSIVDGKGQLTQTGVEH